MDRNEKGDLAAVNPFDPSLTRKPVLFAVGSVEVPDAARPIVRPVEQVACIMMHERGMWGAVDECDEIRNEELIRQKGQIVSLYWTRAGVPIYVVTNLRTERTVIMR